MNDQFNQPLIPVLDVAVSARLPGVHADIPDDLVAKLMYYLECVKFCLPGLDIPDKLTEYNHYLLLSYDEKDQVLALAIKFSPRNINGVFVQGGQSVTGLANNFLELTATATSTIAADQFVIAGQASVVVRKMYYELQWSSKNYYTPVYKLSMLPSPIRYHVFNPTPIMIPLTFLRSPKDSMHKLSSKNFCFMLCVLMFVQIPLAFIGYLVPGCGMYGIV